jgi:hypothetical protein
MAVVMYVSHICVYTYIQVQVQVQVQVPVVSKEFFKNVSEKVLIIKLLKVMFPI